jgi:hypothetical protein
MKTSLNILRATNACTGGFARQASFWTVRPTAKAIEYPIWLIGLTGNYDDLSWAIHNSLIVDEKEFEELRNRTFWPMFQSLFWQHITADYILKAANKKKGDFVRDALQEGLKITNREQAEAWMAKYRRFKLSTTLFSNVVNHTCWRDPQQYLGHLTEAIFSEKTEPCLEHERLPFDLDSHLPGHDSRTMKTLVKRVARPMRRRDEDDDDTEEPSSRVKDAVKTEGKKFYFNLPKSENGRVVTKGESFAYVVLNEDPWPVALQFMLDNKVPQVIGSKMNLSKVSPDGVKPPQFAASLHLNDPRTIFTLMHLLQAQDFDLLKAMHVEQKLGTLVRATRNYGPGSGDRMDDLDTMIDNVDGDWSDAHTRIIESQETARMVIEEAGPTGGAIRERNIRNPRDSSWDGDENSTPDDEDVSEDEEADSDV